MNLDVSTDSGMSFVYDKVNKKIKEKSNNPIVMAILISVVLLYVVLFNVIGVKSRPVEKSASTNMIQLFAWALFLLLISVNGLQYFFQINIQTAISNLFDGNPQIGIKIKPKKGFEDPTGGSEVFHIGDNVYTYDEAKILCTAHDGELASYEQVEKAYGNGAEWCSYGWSKDQMALYPTQKATYNKLKGISGQENSCGRPGVNGGFIKNKQARFGVNCFAPKNKPSNIEKQIMNSSSIIPTVPETEDNKKINFYKKNIHRIVKKPFNSDKWSSF
mgnify:CR=1 FL=1|tara:strand:- start:3953 stop:4774 length:822 start_codon:yes stop_codon:yes gene_type:complete